MLPVTHATGPTRQEFTQRAHTIAHRVGRFLKRQGLLERTNENSYLAADDTQEQNPAERRISMSWIQRLKCDNRGFMLNQNVSIQTHYGLPMTIKKSGATRMAQLGVAALDEGASCWA
jgi:alpha-D-ribose 1-methylphosphonate 5-triphosphate synthase subunit PhnI